MNNIISKITGILFLIIYLNGCDIYSDEITSPSFGEINKSEISLSVKNDSAIADGMSKVELILELEVNDSTRIGNVTFTTSPIGLFINENDSIILDFDLNGKISTFLTSTTVGHATITANIFGVGIKTTNVYFSSPCNNNLDLQVLNDSVDADGVSTIELLFVIDPTSISTNQTVDFTINPIGSFLDNSNTMVANIDKNGQTRVFIKSSSFGKTNLNASINNLCSINTLAFFKPSYPDQILIEPTIAVLEDSLGANTKVSAKLFKSNNGLVSSGLKVQYSDMTKSGPYGVFTNSTLTNDKGESSATYILQDTSYHDFVSLMASIIINERDTVKAINKILIK